MRTSLDLLKSSSLRPTLVNEKQNDQFNRRHGADRRAFDPDDLVYAQVLCQNNTEWIPGHGQLSNARVQGTTPYCSKMDVSSEHIRTSYVTSSRMQVKPILPILIDEFQIQVPTTAVAENQPNELVPDTATISTDEDDDNQNVMTDDEPKVPTSIGPPKPVRQGRYRRLPAWLASYDLILELKRDMERKGTVYKTLAEEVLDEGVTVRTLTAEVNP